MNIEQITALVDDRKTLLVALGEISGIAEQDYGISRTSLIKIHDTMKRTLNSLKYDTVPSVAEPVNR